jgi:hypothetical protein
MCYSITYNKHINSTKCLRRHYNVRNMKNPIKVVLLPTKDKTSISIDPTGHYHYESITNDYGGYKYPYITVSQEVEPIKEGDWFLKPIYKSAIKTEYEPIQADKGYFEGYGYDFEDCRKIIATDDPKLVYNHRKVHDVQAVSMESSYHKPIPQLQQSFLKEFVANPDGKYEVEYENKQHSINYHKDIWKDNFVLKLNQDNTVNITSVEKNL